MRFASAEPSKWYCFCRRLVQFFVLFVQSLSDATREPFEDAVRQIAEITARLLDDLPARRQPPTTVPPLRRADVQARIAAREAHERAHELGLPHEHEDEDDHVHEPAAV